MGNQLIVFNKWTSIEEQLESLSSCELMLGVMFVDPGLATAKQRFLSNVVPSLHESLGLIYEPSLVLK
jgi:hypothetical protein